jgi:predicted MFS family arabinose efflux permease
VTSAQHWPEEAARPRKPDVPHWGKRTLGFLAVLLAAVIISSLQGHYTVLTLLLLLVGFVGAALCSVMGLVTMYRVPPDQRVRGRLRDD